MAITIQPLELDSVHKIIRDADVDATAENDVNGGAATLIGVDLDNEDNAAVTYLHFFNTAAPTVGTTTPDMVLMIAASVRRSYFIQTGVVFDTSLSFCAKTVGGTAGTTGPTSDVIASLVLGG